MWVALHVVFTNLSLFSPDGLRGNLSRLPVPPADVVDVLGVNDLPVLVGLVDVLSDAGRW